MVHTAGGADPDYYKYAPTTGLLQYREEIRHSFDHDTNFYWYDGVGQLYSAEHRHYWLCGAPHFWSSFDRTITMSRRGVISLHAATNSYPPGPCPSAVLTTLPG